MSSAAAMRIDLDARGPLAHRLLDGPAPQERAEPLDQHLERLGPRPAGGPGVIQALLDSGLLGRGGAAFPAGRKWEAVASGAARGAVVVVNVAEGEPLSAKDRLLVALRPHLVLDGAAMAAESVGAQVAYLYVDKAFGQARKALKAAIRERRRARLRECRMVVVKAPARYVAGESSAVVNRINGGPAKPTTTPPRPYQSGVSGLPTLVQNAETIAHAAMVGRFGAGWFRELGTAGSPGSSLLTLSGAVAAEGVLEVELGWPLAEIVEAAGGVVGSPIAVLLGGYFGTWVPWAVARDLAMDDLSLDAEGASIGCGVVAVLAEGACGLAETSRIVEYLAAESAGQCGPCVYGLASISAALKRIVAGDGGPSDLERLRRWSGQVAGRGACHHPDGALRILNSALSVFAADLHEHVDGRPCRGAGRPPSLPVPRAGRGWR